MPEFCPLPPDVRRRIEKWLKEHLDESAGADDVPCVVSRDGSDLNVDALAKIPPRRLSSSPSTNLP